MKVLFPAVRVSNLGASLAFYTAVGFEVVGQVEGSDGTRLVMLSLPEEGEVSLELVSPAHQGPVDAGGLDHLAIQVDDLEALRAALAAAGLDVGRVESPGGEAGPRTVTVVDPDGHHLELVQWPPGHPVGMTRADFEPPPELQPAYRRRDERP